MVVVIGLESALVRSANSLKTVKIHKKLKTSRLLADLHCTSIHLVSKVMPTFENIWEILWKAPYCQNAVNGLEE